MNTQKTEWPYMKIERELSAIANEFGTGTADRMFKGTNFITNNIVARKKLRGKPVAFELSYGTGMSSDYVYGVTFADKDGMNFHDQNKCCHTFEEVRETLENFTA